VDSAYIRPGEAMSSDVSGWGELKVPETLVAASVMGFDS
jgi:hypothetical protein